MSANEISSKLLKNVNLISIIYDIIKNAGIEATNNSIVKSKQSDTCIIKANQPGITRFSGCTTSKVYSIEYDANDLVIVGGAALNLYDFKLNEFKERHKMSGLESFVKKMTSDIDIVWWPRSILGKNVSNNIITSQSPAIQTLASVFADILQQKFNENLSELTKFISDLKSILVEKFETKPAGVININISFEVNNIWIKMCDILVHDSGASQRYDIYGREITTLLPMTEDVMYINPLPGQQNSVRYLIINDTDTAVPNILLFVRQQMLAFSNLIRQLNPKSLVNYKRVEFIKYLLSHFTENANNIGNLGEVFSTNNINYTLQVINEINKIVDENIIINKEFISQLCFNQTIPNKEKMELCKRTDELSKVDILRIEGIAPAYPPPPPPIQSYYLESGTNRRLKWLLNSEGNGKWVYLAQPPLPRGPPLSIKKQGGIRRNKTIKNKN
jgi:hypothetical protein